MRWCDLPPDATVKLRGNFGVHRWSVVFASSLERNKNIAMKVGFRVNFIK
jgi:hypothetical protein